MKHYLGVFLLWICLIGKAAVAGSAGASCDGMRIADLAARAGQDDVKAQELLGWCYAVGKGVKADAQQAVRWFSRAASQGSVFAQRKLGTAYAQGLGVAQDYGTAIDWLSRVVEGGHADVKLDLAKLYLEQSPRRDVARALALATPFAEKGVLDAQFLLGRIYASQLDPPDVDKALAWYRRAAERGDADAQNNLGMLYLRGKGVARNAALGNQWIRRAAMGGNPTAQFNLGVACLYGEGVARDEKQALYWLELAASQGYRHAWGELARMYGDGLGVPHNTVASAALRMLAQRGGTEDSRASATGQPGPRFTGKEREQAQRLADAMYRSKQPLETLAQFVHQAPRREKSQPPDAARAARVLPISGQK